MEQIISEVNPNRQPQSEILHHAGNLTGRAFAVLGDIPRGDVDKPEMMPEGDTSMTVFSNDQEVGVVLSVVSIESSVTRTLSVNANRRVSLLVEDQLAPDGFTNHGIERREIAISVDPFSGEIESSYNTDEAEGVLSPQRARDEFSKHFDLLDRYLRRKEKSTPIEGEAAQDFASDYTLSA